MNTQTGEILDLTPEQVAGLTSDIVSPYDEEPQFTVSSDPIYVQLARRPKYSCRKCYGRGHVGRCLRTQQYIPCGCVR